MSEGEDFQVGGGGVNLRVFRQRISYANINKLPSLGRVPYMGARGEGRMANSQIS